jgi:hypothetical protein
MTNNVLELFPFLVGMERIEFIFSPKIHISLAAAVVRGVYIVFDYTNNRSGKILYVGIAGSDKKGVINSHQLPRRLLAVIYPPQIYIKKIKLTHGSRNIIWPMMMKIDNITAIKICCFFPQISEEFMVEQSKIPHTLECLINSKLKDLRIKQPWSQRHFK